jgi:hypothetical protein
MPFSITLDSSKLSKGLRPSKRMPRNSGFLVECKGAMGKDGVLQVMDQLTRMDTDTITDPFPYPQIFVFTNLIIVCGKTKIYEWIAGALVLKLTVTAGSTWSCAAFFDHVYLSNSKVAVIRNASDKTYSETTDLPIASTILDFNGQCLIGAPGVMV